MNIHLCSSYFDVNRRGTRFWPTAILLNQSPQQKLQTWVNHLKQWDLHLCFRISRGKKGFQSAQTGHLQISRVMGQKPSHVHTDLSEYRVPRSIHWLVIILPIKIISHFGIITSISDTPHILQSMCFVGMISCQPFFVVFFSPCSHHYASLFGHHLELAMVSDLWDSPAIKRKKVNDGWFMYQLRWVISKNPPIILGDGVYPIMPWVFLFFCFFVEGLWMFIFTKDPWYNRIETTGSWAPGQWMPTLRLGASGGDEQPPFCISGLNPGLPSHDHKWRPSHGDITSWMTFFQ